MESQTYQDVATLSAYRDLLQHPGYKALLNDLSQIKGTIQARLLNSHSDEDTLRCAHEMQTFNRIMQVLEFYPQEAARRLEDILGDDTEIKGVN